VRETGTGGGGCERRARMGGGGCERRAQTGTDGRRWVRETGTGGGGCERQARGRVRTWRFRSSSKRASASDKVEVIESSSVESSSSDISSTSISTTSNGTPFARHSSSHITEHATSSWKLNANSPSRSPAGLKASGSVQHTSVSCGSTGTSYTMLLSEICRKTRRARANRATHLLPRVFGTACRARAHNRGARLLAVNLGAPRMQV
jgi:hypothetical protein